MRIIICFLMLLTSTSLFGQRVKLSGIPGQDSGLDINDMLDQIMAPYYSELERIENKQLDKNIELQLLNDFKTNIDNFERVNKYIAGYESAFRSLTNENSDPSSLSIQVDRIAKKGKYTVNIRQLAQKDAFSSPAISVDQQIPAGIFTVSIGEDQQTVEFLGGNVIDLADLMQKRLSDFLETKLINTSSDKKTLSFSGKKEGADNAIVFSGNLAPLLDSRILTKGELIETPILLNNTNVLTISNSHFQQRLDIQILPDSFLTFNIKSTDIKKDIDDIDSQLSLSNLQRSVVGEISNDQFLLPGVAPILEDFNEKIEKKEPVQKILFSFENDTVQEFPLVSTNISVALKELAGKRLKNIEIISENIVSSIDSLKITSSPDGALQPYNVITKAQDSILHLDGVEVIRPNNIISDLLPGVTLNLRYASQKNIDVEIKADFGLVKETIVQWVYEYNNIMEEIYKFVTLPMNKIGRLKPLHQRQKDNEDLKEGTFFGNSSLIGYRDRLRRVIGIMHGSSTNEVNLLDQIGIYVRRANDVSSDPEALRKGTLTLNINELEEKIESHFDDVYRLFVNDTDGDNIGDLGVSIASAEANKLMIGNQGYLARVTQENDRVNKEFTRQIAKLEDEIDRVELKERRDLLQMSQAVAASKAQSESLKQRFNN